MLPELQDEMCQKDDSLIITIISELLEMLEYFFV